MNTLATDCVTLCKRNMASCSFEGSVAVVANWGRGYLAGLRAANAITEDERQDCEARIKAAETEIVQNMQSIRREYAREVA